MELDITGSREDVFRRMHQDTRKKCRRAERRGVRIRSGSEEDLPVMARFLRLTANRKRIAVRDEQYLRELLRAFPADRVRLFLAEADREPIAGVLVAAAGDRAWYVYGGFDYSRRHLYPMEALHVAMIEWARQRNCRTLDLGGTCTEWPPAPTDKGYGVYCFKKRFGAVSFLRAPYCDLVGHPLLYRLFRVCENSLLPLVLESGPARFEILRRRWATRNEPCSRSSRDEIA
jgi:lipid II:glycine glycyltransferase (peptidoglycan interpeptide bridge formation enzyme)